MKSFLIGGTIIDDTAQAWAFEDVTPAQVRAALQKLEPEEDITFEISSPGGSVTAGIAIANMIREASKNGHPCKAHVVGIAASMASVITCACDEIEIDESAFMMIHNPWTFAHGDAEDLRKSADVLDQMKQAIMCFYRGKFDRTDDELVALMDAETWFTGAEAETFGFKAKVIKCEEGVELKAAACAREIPGFARIPENAARLFVVGQHEPTAEEKKEAEFNARLAAAMKSRDAEINSLKESLDKATTDAAMQVTVAVQDAIKDFTDKLEKTEKELTEARAEVTSLTGKLADTQKELQATASALEVKETALAQLNANVNRPAQVIDEPSYDEIVNDPKSTPRQKLAAAKKELAKRRASGN